MICKSFCNFFAEYRCDFDGYLDKLNLLKIMSGMCSCLSKMKENSAQTHHSIA